MEELRALIKKCLPREPVSYQTSYQLHREKGQVLILPPFWHTNETMSAFIHAFSSSGKQTGSLVFQTNVTDRMKSRLYIFDDSTKLTFLVATEVDVSILRCLRKENKAKDDPEWPKTFRHSQRWPRGERAIPKTSSDANVYEVQPFRVPSLPEEASGRYIAASDPIEDAIQYGSAALESGIHESIRAIKALFFFSFPLFDSVLFSDRISRYPDDCLFFSLPYRSM